MPEHQFLRTIVVLPVSDVEAAAQWYSNALGFEIIYIQHTEAHGSPDYAVMQRDRVLVHLARGSTEGRSWPLAGTGYLYLMVHDVEAVLAEVTAKGIAIARGLQDEKFGARGFNLTDPSGNIVHLEQND